MRWFTSDLHFEHPSILKVHARQKFSTPEEHDETILDNLFSCMSNKDILYVLGDIFWKKADTPIKQKFFRNLRRTGIQFHWISGNHDRTFDHPQIQSKSNLLELVLNKKKKDEPVITLCHYPLLCWNKSHYNAWHLYGHLHESRALSIMKTQEANGNILLRGKRLNVNTEFWNFKPLSLDQLKEIMGSKENNWDYLFEGDSTNLSIEEK